MITPEEIAPHVERLQSRLEEIRTLVSDSAIYADQKRCRELNRELQQLTKLFDLFEAWKGVRDNLTENHALLTNETDDEMLEMVKTDCEALEKQNDLISNVILQLVLPPDPHSGSRVIVEIHPAAGGDEAALFAAELYRAYTRYGELQNWKIELLSMTASDLGGIKDVVFTVAGETAYDQLKFESGVHRVQRVPVTESGGRIHTSTLTVAVLPEAEEVDIDIRSEDLRFDVFRSSGPGGQCVNTTDSAVRVTHIPTGLSVASQQEKSQHRNREIALRILRSRLLEQKQREEAEKRADSKRTQVGTGDRSERIRTYNFPQSRCTDHRYGISVYDLPGMMEGNFAPLMNQILAADAQLRMEELGVQN